LCTHSQDSSITMAEQPKKPTGGAYGQFLAENRPALAKECAGQSITAVTKLAGERFKKLGEAEKEKFQKKYLKVMEQYKKDMEAFLAAGGEKKVSKRKGKDDDGDGKKRAKKDKDPNAPKRPAGGAFGCFLAAKRPTFQKSCAGKPAVEVTKMAAEAWKTMSAADKKPYEDDYEVKKAKYEEAMKAYNASDNASDNASED